MLTFMRKYYLYAILSVVGIVTIITFEPTLTALLYTHTSPPVKVYKVTPLEQQETTGRNTTGAALRSDTEMGKSFSTQHGAGSEYPDRATEPTKNITDINSEDADGVIPVNPFTVRPPHRKRGSPEVITGEKRMRESERLREINAEMKVLIPFISEDRDIHLRFLDLWEEHLKILQAQGRLYIDSGNPFMSIKIERLILKVTSDGKIPVSIGEEIAAIYAENGHHAQAAWIRNLTQRATEKGNQFYKPEHLEENK